MKMFLLTVVLLAMYGSYYQKGYGVTMCCANDETHNSNVMIVDSKDSVPLVRAHHDLVYNEEKQVVLMSGGSTPVNEGSNYRFFNDCWTFDGKMWVRQGNAGNERSGFKMVYHLKEKKIFSFGGYVDGRPVGDLRILENGSWKTMTDMSEMAAAEPGFVYDSYRDRLVAFGGSAGRGKVSNTTWEWDGKAWSKLDGEGPEGRQAFVMVYDSRRKKILVTGGMDETGKEFDDNVWEYDGANWKKIIHAGNGPKSLVSSGYTYDSKRGLLLVFGGMSAGKAGGETWSWNGKIWQRLSNTGPSPRAMGCLAYDARRDRVVLFGGRPRWPNDANDTWEWDGQSWKEWKK